MMLVGATAPALAKADRVSFDSWADDLPANIRADLKDVRLEGMDPRWPREDDRRPHYCMMECPDGEYPTLRIFTTVDAMVDRMRTHIEKEEDICLFPFFGIPLPFGKEPHRLLFLPDNRAIPLTKQAEYAPVHDVPIQEDGFVGTNWDAAVLIDEDAEREAAMRGDTDFEDEDEDDEDGDEEEEVR